MKRGASGLSLLLAIDKPEGLTSHDVVGRVRRIFGDSVIRVTAENGEVIAQYPREHMAPGEMEHIMLPKVRLEKAGGKITVSAEEKEENAQ